MKKYKLKGMKFEDAISTMLTSFDNRSQSIMMPSIEATGYMLSADIISDIDLPRHNIAFYDGYAMRHSNIINASPENPVKLKLVGYILREEDEGRYSLKDGETVYVSANAPIPDEADIVIRKEWVLVKDDYIIVRKRIDKGENIVFRGEDIKRGEIVFNKGRIIKPRDITLLLELGLYRINVYRKPKIGIFSVGTELKERLESGKPYPDNYSILIQKSLEMMCTEASVIGILPDDIEVIKECVLRNIDGYDMILMVGGASVGENDYTGRALEDIGEVIFHGTNISPGKVSGLVKVRDKPVFLVPGHILSAVSCVYNFVYKFIIEKFFDGNETLPRVIAKLAEEPTTRPGRYIFRPVTLRWMENTLYAYPHERRMGGSTLLSSLTGGNGFIVISPDYTPKKGDYIVVRLYSHYELI